MPYLNWKDASLTQEIAAHATGDPEKHLLAFGITRSQVEMLHPILAEVLEGQPGPELRLDLPKGWIVFWKLREGESRLLLAHPQEDEWVATAALTLEHAALFLEKLSALTLSGQAVALGELAPTGRVSNAEVRIHLI